MATWFAIRCRNPGWSHRSAPFELFVELRENAGGSGANYAIKWEAETDTLVSPPTIEALHSRFQAGYSVAFVSRGRAISEP
jgi:hypothetical protein